MDLSKLRRGEMIAAVGGIVLLFAMFFLDWYEVGGGRRAPRSAMSRVERAASGAWDGQGFTGTIANLVILAAALAAIGARGRDRHFAHGRAAGRGERAHRRARHRGGRDGAAADGVPAGPERVHRACASASCSR